MTKEDIYEITILARLFRWRPGALGQGRLKDLSDLENSVEIQNRVGRYTGNISNECFERERYDLAHSATDLNEQWWAPKRDEL